MFRVISSVLGLIGALSVALRGFFIRSQLNDPMAAASRSFGRAMGEDTSVYDTFEMLSIAFLIAATLGALAALLLLLRVGSPKALGLLMLLSGALPLINSESAPFGVPLLLAGILAFFVRKKAA